MPRILLESWDSVFMAVTNTSTVFSSGTSFIIHRKEKAHFDELFFMTNNHVLARECPGLGKCAPMSLMQRALVAYKDDRPVLVDLENESGLEYLEVEIFKRSTNPDMALIKVRIPKSAMTPRPLKLARECAGASTGKLYTIGFSKTKERKYTRVEIEAQDVNYKRWSEGISTGHKHMSDAVEGTVHLEGTTIDILGGGSGGPVLNEKGELVGLMKAGYGSERDSFSYRGDETPGALEPHSFIVSCDELQKFLDF